MKNFFYHLTFLVLLSACMNLNAKETAPLSPDAFIMMTNFYQYDKIPDMDVQITDKREYADHTREKIVFRSFRGDWVNGYIAIPKAGKVPYPCVVVPHGGGSQSIDLWDQGDPRSYSILQDSIANGFALMALDAQYHGERMRNKNFERTGKILQEGRFNIIREQYIDTVTDYRQALDYLETRPEIDSTRLAVYGYSMGGIISFLLAALDQHIKVSVVCAAPISTVSWVVWSPYFFAQAVDTCAILMLMGKEDRWYSVEEAQKTYDSIPSVTKEIQFYDTGHQLPIEYQQKAMEWIVNYLK